MIILTIEIEVSENTDPQEIVDIIQRTIEIEGCDCISADSRDTE